MRKCAEGPFGDPEPMTSLDVSLSATSFPSILTTVIHQAGCYPVMLRACYRQARVLRLQSVQSVRGVQSVQHPSSFSLCAWTRSPVRMASTTTNSSNPEQPAPIRFSEGEDTVQVTTGLNDLRQRGWQLDADGMGILKTYYFKSYFKAVVCLFLPPLVVIYHVWSERIHF